MSNSVYPYLHYFLRAAPRRSPYKYYEVGVDESKSRYDGVKQREMIVPFRAFIPLTDMTLTM